MSDKSTGQTVVNGASSNVTYSFVSMVAGYDLYIIIRNDKNRVIAAMVKEDNIECHQNLKTAFVNRILLISNINIKMENNEFFLFIWRKHYTYVCFKFYGR